METAIKIQASIGRIAYTTSISIRGHHLTGDEPPENGGQDQGPRPYELVLSGLGACTAGTLKMYADRKGWPVEHIYIDLEMTIDKTTQSHLTHISRSIRFEGDLDEEHKLRLIEIAEKCPVHRLLTNEVIIKTALVS